MTGAELWSLALADSGVDPASVFLLSAPAGQAPRYFAAGHSAASVGYTLASDQDARDQANVHLYRIALPDLPPDANEVEQAIWAALARHELEHVRQDGGCGTKCFALADLLKTSKFGTAAGNDPSNWGRFINTIPVEADANAAASMFLRSHFPQSVIDQIATSPDYAPLVRAENPPNPPDTLVERMVDFIVPYQPAIDHLAAANGMVPAEFLRWWSTDSSEVERLWLDRTK
jgi:hypothetical protein